MLRRFGAAVAVLAVLYGLAAAPFTHAHHAIDSVRDASHPHGATLVHSHPTAHSHHHSGDHDPDAPYKDEERDQVWGVSTFLFQQPPMGHAPAPAVLSARDTDLEVTSTWLGVHRPQPTAHGPPVGPASSLRAPPTFPPVFA